MNKLPETGFLRIWDIIGQDAVTEKQAAENRRKGKCPKRPRPQIPAVIPVEKSCWWQGVRDGRFPAAVKLGPRVTAWRVEDILALIASGGAK